MHESLTLGQPKDGSQKNVKDIRELVLGTALPGFRGCNPSMVKAESELGP